MSIGVASAFQKVSTTLKGSSGTYSVEGKYPKLVADFEDEYYRAEGVNTFSNLITHSRLGQATMVDSDGLIKWAPHNLLTYSEEFDNAAWTKAGSSTVTANSTTAPDGTTTAETVNGAAGSQSYIIQIVPTVSGLLYTLSLYAKANTTNFLQLAAGGSVFGVNVWANFDLSDGTVGSVGSLTTASIHPVGSGWYRCVITGSAVVTSAVGNMFGIIPVESSSSVRFPTNVGTTSIYIWGAHTYRSDLGGMVNNPDRGDSYVPTTSSAVYLPRRTPCIQRVRVGE